MKQLCDIVEKNKSKYSVRACNNKDYDKVLTYIDKFKKDNSKCKLRVDKYSLVTYFQNGRIYCIDNNGTIEGLCILLKRDATDSVVIPFYNVDNKHYSQLSSFVMLMTIAKFVGSKKLVIQHSGSKVFKYLINCGDGFYVINYEKALMNPIVRFLYDTFINPPDLTIEPEIVEFQNEYKRIFPNEHYPETTLIKNLRTRGDVVFEGKYNLVYLKELEDSYEVLGVWCLANSSYSMKQNISAFNEGLSFVDTLTKPFNLYSGLKEEYVCIVEKISNRNKNKNNTHKQK